MGKKRNRPGKRNRERKSQQTVLAGVWAWAGRDEVSARVDGRGRLSYTVPHPDRVDAVGREHAAAWLREGFAPRLSHDTCYLLLWGH